MAIASEIGLSGGWAYDVGTMTSMYTDRSTVVHTVCFFCWTGSQLTPSMPITSAELLGTSAAGRGTPQVSSIAGCPHAAT